MSDGELLETITDAGDAIVSALGKDKKRNKSDRTTSYRDARLAEISKLWHIYNLAIKELTPPIDPCITTAHEKYSKAYTELMDRLNAILDNPKANSENSKSTSDESNNLDDEQGELLMRMQSKRLVALRHVLSEVLQKLYDSEIPSSSYSEVKKNKIMNAWNRIDTENETVSENIRGYTNYKKEFDAVERLTDKALIYLQDYISIRSPGNSSDGLKLNRVEIQKFAGDYFKWITFKDLFTSMVINNKKIGDAERMQHLKTHVTGEVADMINDLTVSSANFSCAWDRLLNRYNNERVIIGKLINRVINQPNCKGDSKSLKRILDTTDQMILQLKNMQRPTEHWNDWIVVIIGQKLDDETQRDWERLMGKTTSVPTWDELKQFLEEQFRLMERLESSQKRQNQDKAHNPKNMKIFQTNMETGCVVCKEAHTLYICPKWKAMSPKERLTIVKKNKWCKKCLRSHDENQLCDKSCKKCNKGHSTWLHENRLDSKNQLTINHATFITNPYQVLLATAVIKTTNIFGQPMLIRVMIDSGAEGSLITERAAALISAKSISTNIWLSSLAGHQADPMKKIQLRVEPRFESSFFVDLEMYILKTLPKKLPGHDLNPSGWKHIKKLVWADPYFHKSGPIDALLGMDAVAEIMKPGLIRGIQGQPMAQETHLGWIMSGKIDPTYPVEDLKCFTVKINEVSNDLARFWELEEINPERTLTADEIRCEYIYESTMRKNTNGQFIVNIPFKNEPDGPNQLGESKGQAIARFLQVERRLIQDQTLGAEYKRVMQEYINLGHLIKVAGENHNEKRYYIPHHAVIKPGRLTTKVRVVFDASAKTTTGWSLNQCMYTGAKQQRDLADILINWRIYQYVYKADIEKMYRMIKLAAEDQKYHTIVWRDSPKDQLQEYQLTTVTFGTAAAPFLATRTLVAIAKEKHNIYPLAAAALMNNFYVDDLIGGNHSFNDAVKCKDELFQALEPHHFNLRKWTSNNDKFLDTVAPEMTERSLQKFSEEDLSKALGLAWNPQTDNFQFNVNWLQPDQSTWTKRQFLAESSKLFDPLGWLAPITINAKIMMQDVWTSKTPWDTIIPPEIAIKWEQFRKEFKELEKIRINRWINFQPGCELSLHGFSDASEKAYSAAIYARIKMNGKIESHLITAKTRVAPIKTKITLPRLELCGAVLVSNLMTATIKALKVEDASIYLWTDSMITLGWIIHEPNRWTTFVANRVSEIRINKHFKWDYVPSEQNPADCASRGIMPKELINHPLWWTGPAWLSEEMDKWPTGVIPNHNLEQRSKLMVGLTIVTTNEFVNRFSSWNKLKRITAYALRFKNKKNGNLTVAELKAAEYTLIRQCQKESFYDEINALSNNLSVNKKSKLKSLNAFIDKNGILRVGGRLCNAQIPYDTKFPIILPDGKHMTKIILHQMHIDTVHGGPKLMRSLLMRKYWIIQGKRMINSEYSQCIACRKFKAESYKQQMGDLPTSRVTLEHPFSFTGVDYAGPIEIKSSNLKSARIQKGYIALYVCMATKAVHLELVSDQSTEAFLASFERFTTRRGLVTEMYSDNGSNFEGANNALKKFYVQQNKEIAKIIINKGINWNFIPPGSPNFGGLWERAVRSMKDHLKKKLKTARLTFEEYATLLCQVEACLNSRPICSTSDNLDDLDFLTPGHFLVGRPLLAPPQQHLGTKLTNHRNRWTYVKTLYNQLWERWNTEYLVELQQRHKWQETSENAKPGDVVVIKDEDLKPRNWLVGRIEAVHKGADGKVRVATIRVPGREKQTEINENLIRKSGKIQTSTQPTPMKSKVIQRPIRKLCPLLTEDKENQTAATMVNQQATTIIDNQPIRQQSKNYNLRSRKIHLITTALFFFGLIVGAAAIPMSENKCVQVTTFRNNAGIYFEDLGRASVTTSEWKILVYFNLTRYNQEFQLISEAITTLTDLCKAAEGAISNSAGMQCSQTITLIHQQLEDLLEGNKIISSNKQVNHEMRNKRAAPFNFVSWIGNKLFGFMDANAAEKFEQQINEAKIGQLTQDKLIATQTSIIEFTRNLLKESVATSQKNFETIMAAIGKLSRETDLYRKRDQINGWMLHISIIMNKLENDQRNMINMLTDLQQGHVSSYLFTPRHFQQELDKINDLIPNGYKLPISPRNDLKSFYELMRGRMRITKTNIILEIILPLLSVEEFQMFRIIPVPVQQGHEQISISPESPYLLITLKRNLFYQLSEKDLNECIQTHGIPMICPVVQLYKATKSSKGVCERELLTGSNNINQCKVKVAPNDEVWIQLSTKNKWIFSLPNETIFNIIKDHNVHTMKLQGAGIMEIQPGCEVSHQGITLIGQAQLQTTTSHSFTPQLNLSDLMKQKGASVNVVNFTLSTVDQFQEIKHEVNKIKHTINTNHTLHGWIHITITILMIGMLILIFFIIRFRLTIIKWWPRRINVTTDIAKENGDQISIKPETQSSDHSDQSTNAVITTDRNTFSGADIVNSRHGPGGCPFRT